jgi:hypothetical protein
MLGHLSTRYGPVDPRRHLLVEGGEDGQDIGDCQSRGYPQDGAPAPSPQRQQASLQPLLVAEYGCQSGDVLVCQVESLA